MMKINLFNRKRKSADVSQEQLSYMWERGLNGELKATTLNEITYFICLKTLSETIGKMPLKLECYDNTHGVKVLTDNPLYDMLRYKPNPYMNATTFWSKMEWNRNHYGNAYAYIQGTNSSNYSLWILNPVDVEVWYDNAKLLSDVEDVWYLYSAPDGNRYKLSHAEVFHVKNFETDATGLIGVPIKKRIYENILGSLKAQKMLNSLYDRGLTGKCVMNYTGDLSDANIKKFMDNLKTFVDNDNGMNIVPMPLGFSLTPLAQRLADSQFLELKQYAALQIAACFGVKPNQINDYSKASYASAEMQNLSFYSDTILFIQKQYEEECRKLLSTSEKRLGYRCRFNEKVLLRADAETQMKVLVSGITNGVITPNEAREELGRSHEDGGDRLYFNGTNIPVEDAGKQYNIDNEQQHEE